MQTTQAHQAYVPLLAFSLGLAALTSGCSSKEAAAKPADKAAAPLRVNTAQATEQRMPRVLRVTGSLAANRESDVAATTSGRVQSVHAERGTSVGQGAALARIDARDAANQSAEANAMLQSASVAERTAELDCTRAENLFASRVISQAEYDRIRASCSSAVFTREASVARKHLAERMLGDSVVRSPFAGFVAERFVEVGEFVTPGRQIAKLVELDPMRLELSVPESATAMVSTGSPVKFTVSAFPGTKFSAAVRYVGPVVRRAGRDFVVEAVVANADGRLRPGMFATAELGLGELTAITVPKHAIAGSEVSPRVFVVKQGKVEERVVQIGSEHGGNVIVRKGVQAGDSVVLAPDRAVKDGARVQ